MKKIHRQILGFHPILSLDNNIESIIRKDWFGNANNPIDLESIPDQYEEEIFNRNERTRIINIYKDSSDFNEDENGKLKEIERFLIKPKKIYLEKYDLQNNRIKRQVRTNDEVEGTTQFEYDSKNNLIKNSYVRLGYTQHYHQYKYDSDSNLIEIITYKDASHGKEIFEPETKSVFTYDFDDDFSFNRLDFKYKDNDFHERSKTTTFVKQLENKAFEVETLMKHLRTGSKGRTLRIFDRNLSQISNYSFIDENYHPHSVNYEFEYDKFQNWIMRRRIRMDKTITLKSKQQIKYL